MWREGVSGGVAQRANRIRDCQVRGVHSPDGAEARRLEAEDALLSDAKHVLAHVAAAAAFVVPRALSLVIRGRRFVSHSLDDFERVAIFRQHAGTTGFEIPRA